MIVVSIQCRSYRKYRSPAIMTGAFIVFYFFNITNTEHSVGNNDHLFFSILFYFLLIVILTLYQAHKKEREGRVLFFMAV